MFKSAVSEWPNLAVAVLAAAFFAANPGECTTTGARTRPVVDARGHQFIGFNHFGAFEKQSGTRRLEMVMESPVILTKVRWDELIVSWDAQMPPDTYLKIEARAIHANGPTRFYTMGLWSNDPASFPRESVPGQDDGDGKVATDTLILNRAAEQVQIRLTLGSETREQPKIKFLGLCLTDTQSHPGILPPNQQAWGTILPVPEKSQMSYPNGNVLCSPTALSMLMGYWSKRLADPELDRDVPEIVEGIYDAKWNGTGNWAFNMAYAGSFRGMRSYVTRLSDVSELEDWVACGVPVGLSLCYDRLRGRQPRGRGNGHLVVCVGFTQNGDVVVNDPGTSQNVQKVFLRKSLISAWAYSKNAVYLVYPEGQDVPKDRFGHWASWTSRGRLQFQ